MKGLVFTMDAVFALLITLVALSILLFFNYFTQTPYSIRYTNSQALFTNLASSSVESVQNSSVLARLIANQFRGSNETSPQFLGGTTRNSSNIFGPLQPILSFIFNPGNAITTGIVADYGNIYFGGNTILYAVNASTNMTVWTINTITPVTSTPALYAGVLFYSNSIELTAVSAKNGGTVVWSVPISPLTPTTPIIVYDNLVIFGGSDFSIHAYYATNGTTSWTTSVGSTPQSLLDLKGTLVVRTSSGFVATIVTGGNSANQLISKTYPISNLPTNIIAAAGTRLYFGTNTFANATYTNGTAVPGFPLGVGTIVTGVAVYNNYIAYQTSRGVALVSPSGSSYWTASVPSSFGLPIADATPVIAGQMVYSLWSNGLAGQNLTTGSITWFALMPGVKISPYMTLAYGRLYVVANNAVRVYGSCNSPLHASLLAAAAAMYWNSGAGCGGALLNSIYPTVDYSFYVGNPLPRTTRAASFNGAKGYISAHNTGCLNSSYMSASFWVNVSAFPAATTKLVNYGDAANGCLGATTNCGWFFAVTTSNEIQFSIMNGAQNSANTLPLNTNTWYFVTGVFNGSSVALFINGNTPYTASYAGAIWPTSPNINLTIGGGRPCCDSNYFTGNIVDLQIYSGYLGRSQIFQLYAEGPQGAPAKGFGLVAWYPLQGDSNDYSLFNPGFLTGSAKFVTKTYSAPALRNAFEVSVSSALIPVINYTTGLSNTIRAGVYLWG